MQRRRFITAGLVSISALAMKPELIAARAQPSQLVVTTWGSDWNDRTIEYFEKPLVEPQGLQIIHELNTNAQRRTKIMAERRLPRGTIDVAHVPMSDAFFLDRNSALEKLDFERIPNANALNEQLSRDYFMPWLYSSFEILYNPEFIRTAPESWNDLWNPEYKGKVGINGNLYSDFIQMASLVATGTLHDFDAAKKRLMEMKDAVAPKIYPGQQQLGAGLQNGEVWIAANYRARALQWHADGMPVSSSLPKEGAGVQIYGLVVPKQASNKEGAYTYLNALLDPQALMSLCNINYYAPASTAVTLTGDTGAMIAYTPEEQAKLIVPDFAVLAESEGLWLDWWNREFAS